MSDQPETLPANAGEPNIEADVDTVIEMFGGDLRAAIRSLLIANEFLTTEVERAKEAVSPGYVRRSP